MESVQNAELAATQFVQMIGRLQNMETGFKIDLDGLMKTLTRQTQDNEQRPAS